MTLDCRGQPCPIPFIKTKNALEELTENETLRVWVDLLESIENIEKFLKHKNIPYTFHTFKDYFEIVINSGDAFPLAEEPSAESSKTVVVLSSDKMGDGDPELGRALLQSFLYSLTEIKTLPSALILYQSGVYLVSGNSPVIKDLQVLEELGVDILSCGVCLNYYNIYNQVQIGRISNMYEIAGLMLDNRVLKP